MCTCWHHRDNQCVQHAVDCACMKISNLYRNGHFTYTHTGHELLLDLEGSSFLSFLLRLLFPTNLYSHGTSNPLPRFLLPVTLHVILPPWQRKYQNTLESSRGTCPTVSPSFNRHTACLSWLLPSSPRERAPNILVNVVATNHALVCVFFIVFLAFCHPALGAFAD